ncbi:unnamed protein product [Adineta steineri]|uniref:Uncharacterized protein n=1 Tax=Adineta steineri TaxID=433720 RepID=A0A813TU59_9BILA|nr:unnamed protein product [Adineta steineri]
MSAGNMTSLLKLCSVDLCERSALAVCECHNKDLCNDHFMEHTTQLISVVNQTNINTDQTKNTSLEKRSCLTVLNKWCKSVYQNVKRSNIENNQQIELGELEVNFNESIQNNTIVEDISSKISQQNLFPFEQPYRSVQVASKSSISMACSNKYLLIEQKPYLCLLDQTLTIVKQIPWPCEYVNICWASTLNQFILVTKKNVFTLDENTMELQECTILHHNKKDWSCAACSDTTLYLSTIDMSAFLYEYTLHPSIEFVKEWHPLAICPLYESILTFSYRNEKLAFIICNAHTFQNRLDLHSSITFEVLWSIPLSILARCCSINNDQWIIINALETQLLHISSDGNILQDYRNISSSMNPIVNAIQWSNDTIVTATIKSLNLHKLS